MRKTTPTQHSKVTITRWSDDTYSIEYDGVARRADLLLLLKRADRFYRKHQSAPLSASENSPLVLTSASYGSLAETGA